METIQVLTGVILITCLIGWFVAIQSIKRKIHIENGEKEWKI